MPQTPPNLTSSLDEAPIVVYDITREGQTGGRSLRRNLLWKGRGIGMGGLRAGTGRGGWSEGRHREGWVVSGQAQGGMGGLRAGMRMGGLWRWGWEGMRGLWQIDGLWGQVQGADVGGQCEEACVQGAGTNGQSKKIEKRHICRDWQCMEPLPWAIRVCVTMRGTSCNGYVQMRSGMCTWESRICRRHPPVVFVMSCTWHGIEQCRCVRDTWGLACIKAHARCTSHADMCRYAHVRTIHRVCAGRTCLQKCLIAIIWRCGTEQKGSNPFLSVPHSHVLQCILPFLCWTKTSSVL